MELIEGETLAAVLKRGTLPIDTVLKYGAQIAGALAAAHAKGIVHRDLKPHNIMIGKSGLKVLDFGLARAVEDVELTVSHIVMGTPAYMAPEQCAGKATDARTDLYALGLVVFEMATGKQAVLDPARPTDGMPPQLARILDRCLTPDPEERWQSARDLMAALELITVATPAGTAPQATTRSYRRWLA